MSHEILRLSFIVLALSAAPVFAEERIMMPSGIDNAPSYSLPAFLGTGIAKARHAEKQQAKARQLFVDRLASKYISEDIEEDMDARLSRILSTSNPSEDVIPDEMDVSLDEDGSEELEQVARLGNMPGGIVTTSDAFIEQAERPVLPELNNPEILTVLRDMTPEQIRALGALYAAANPSQMQMPAPPVPERRSQALMPGIPSLSDVASGRVQGLPQQEPQNLLLQGWTVEVLENGRVQMLNPDTPGSEIELEVGMVVGALGEVRQIMRWRDRVEVKFESGDTLFSDGNEG